METSGQSQVLAVLFPRNGPVTRRGWVDPKIRSVGFGEEANLFPIPGIEPRLLDHPARSAVTILTELSRITLEPLDEVMFP
jgi:hypothetical protein